NNYTWFGKVEGSVYSHVILVVKNGKMTGNISVDGEEYQVKPLMEDVHAVYRTNPFAVPEDAPPVPEPVTDAKSPIVGPEPPPDNGSIVDVMVVYSDDAAATSADIESKIQLAIDFTNTSFENSGIIPRLKLVYTAQVDYSETGDSSEDLSNLSAGRIENIVEWRDAYRADLVSLWVANLDIGGRAYVPGKYSVVKASQSSFTMAHELGHNFGAHHDRYTVGKHMWIEPFGYHYGYVNTADRWRTIMSYVDECRDAGFYCKLVPFWSNPDIAYNGAPMGLPEGHSDAADNRKTINYHAVTVANYKRSTTFWADFSAGSLSGSVPLPVEFTDLSGGEIESWLWEFGDGATGT
ncbi:MAG: hypothetical protein GY869_16130, partial [Planctomycetes bacterium]|nr:hypothetical protein [Planctomycetota bacterium]